MSAKPITVTFERGTPLLSGTRPYLARLSEHNEAVATILRLCGFEYNPVGLCFTTLNEDDSSAAAALLRDNHAIQRRLVGRGVVMNYRQASLYIEELAVKRLRRECLVAFVQLSDLSRRIESERESAGVKEHQPPIYSDPEGNPFK